ncbi:MAG: hypothetical protein JWL71_431 [Acidobacteria bacterium]|nr:hypothetical protein [Acidobacteriota bacterium]
MAAAVALGAGFVRSRAKIIDEETARHDAGERRIRSQLEGAMMGRIGFALLFAGSVLQLGPSVVERLTWWRAELLACGVAASLLAATFGYRAWWVRRDARRDVFTARPARRG